MPKIKVSRDIKEKMQIEGSQAASHVSGQVWAFCPLPRRVIDSDIASE